MNLKNPETTMFEDITAKFGKKMHVKRFPEIAKKMDPSKKDFLVTEKNNMSEWSSWEAIEPTTGKIRKYRVRLADVATKLRYPNQAKKP
jgi:hypothetical protein